jgi:tetratricopeptide (TPR) repeat protein
MGETGQFEGICMKSWLNRLWFTLVLWPFYWARIDFWWPLRKREAMQIADLSRLIDARPHNASLYLKRALSIALQRGDAAQGLIDCDTAERLDPKLDVLGEISRIRIGLYRVQSDFASGVDASSAWIQADPQNRYGYFSRAQFRYKQEQYDLAIADYLEGLKYDFGQHREERFKIHLSLAQAHYALKQYEEALTELANAEYYLDKTPDSLLYQRININAAREDLAAMERDIALIPPDAVEVRAIALAQFASIYLKRKQFAEAVKYLNQAIALDDAQPSRFINRAYAKSRLDDLDGALADLDRALEINADNALALNNRASHRLYLGQLEAAQQDIDRAMVLSPDSFHVWNTRGTWHLLRGEYAEALADFEHAETLPSHDPRPSASVIGQVAAHQALGEADTALALWRALGERHTDRGPLLAYVRNKDHWPAPIMALLEAVDARLNAS